MASVTLRARGSAAPATAWERYADPALWPTWAPQIQRVWEWRARVGPVSLRLEHGVGADGDGAATWLRVNGVLPLVLAYAPIARIALGRLVAA